MYRTSAKGIFIDTNRSHDQATKSQSAAGTKEEDGHSPSAVSLPPYPYLTDGTSDFILANWEERRQTVPDP